MIIIPNAMGRITYGNLQRTSREHGGTSRSNITPHVSETASGNRVSIKILARPIKPQT